MTSVLILDGCAMTRECLSILLRGEGYTVHAVGSCEQARGLMKRRTPDVMLCELVLPDGSIVGLLRWMRTNAKNTRTCVLTNVAAKLPLTQAVEAGVAGVQLKVKFTFPTLLKQLRALTEPSASSRASGAPQQPEPPVRHPLPLPAPDPVLEIRAIKPVHTRATMERKLDEHPGLTCSPVVVSRARQIMQSDECSVETIASVISADPSLVSHVLTAASSEDQACESPMNSVFDGLLRIGLERLEQILDHVESIETNPEEPGSPSSLRHDQIRAHSVAVSEIASRIGSQLGVDERRARLGGLLHDLGRFRLLDAFPEDLISVSTRCSAIGVPMHLGEKRMLLVEHDKLTLKDSNAWNLHKDIAQAIGYHHEDGARISSVCSGASDLVISVALADAIAHALGLGHSGSSVIRCVEGHLDQIEREAFDLDDVLEELEDSVRESLAAAGLNPELIRDGVPHAVPELPMSPIYISTNDQDLIGRWVRSEYGDLRPSPETNMAIVHVRTPRDRAELGDKLESLQNRLLEQGGSRPVPVLVLSPTGKNGLGEELMTRHLCMHLRTPFGVSAFEQACNALLHGKQTVEPRQTALAA